jgi:hypothetical protein
MHGQGAIKVPPLLWLRAEEIYSPTFLLCLLHQRIYLIREKTNDFSYCLRATSCGDSAQTLSGFH